MSILSSAWDCSDSEVNPTGDHDLARDAEAEEWSQHLQLVWSSWTHSPSIRMAMGGSVARGCATSVTARELTETLSGVDGPMDMVYPADCLLGRPTPMMTNNMSLACPAREDDASACSRAYSQFVNAPHPDEVPLPFVGRGHSTPSLLHGPRCDALPSMQGLDTGPPLPHPSAGRRPGNPSRRRTTTMLCETPGCYRYREGVSCSMCAVHCRHEDNPTCVVHWTFPCRCTFAACHCLNLHPEDCVVKMCAMHCTAENCERHRLPSSRRQDGLTVPRTRGMRSQAQWRNRVPLAPNLPSVSSMARGRFVYDGK